MIDPNLDWDLNMRIIEEPNYEGEMSLRDHPLLTLRERPTKKGSSKLSDGRVTNLNGVSRTMKPPLKDSRHQNSSSLTNLNS